MNYPTYSDKEVWEGPAATSRDWEKQVAYPTSPEAIAPAGDDKNYPEPVGPGRDDGTIKQSSDPEKQVAVPNNDTDKQVAGTGTDVEATPDRPKKAQNITITRRTLWIAVLVGVIVIGALVGGLVGGLINRKSDSGSSPAATQPANPTPPPSSTPSPSSSSVEPTTTPSVTPSATVRRSTASTAVVVPAGYPSQLSSANLIKNADFRDGLTGWKLDVDNNPNGCWQSTSNPSGSDVTPMIARIYNDKAGVPCSMTQTIADAGTGQFAVAFLFGTYVNDSVKYPGYLVVEAGGSSSSAMLFNVSTSTPIRYNGFETASYTVTAYEKDFVIRFSGWSKGSVWDVALVEVMKIVLQNNRDLTRR